MKNLILIWSLLLPYLAFGQATNSDTQYRNDGETLINGSFEQGKKGYTFTVGSGSTTWAAQSTTSLNGRAMQLTLSAQTFSFKSATTQGSKLSGQNGYVEVYLSANNSGAEFCPLVDGVSAPTTTPNECQPIIAGVGFKPYGIQKVFGATSLNYEIRGVSNASYTGIIYLDDGSVAKSSRVRGIKLDTGYSAQMNASGVVSNENKDWINGSCSYASNEWTCTFITGLVTSGMNCAVNVTDDSSGSSVRGVVSTSSNLKFKPIFDGTAYFQKPVSIVCQKGTNDYLNSTAEIFNTTGGWLIDVSIGGANITTTNSTSYIAFENASLDMVINAGSATAKIPCSSTNSPTGLTCSAGSEQAGVVFTNPKTGTFKACVYAGGGKANITGATAQLVETDINSQTIVQEGKSRVGVADSSTGFQPVIFNQCAFFKFNDVKERAIRFMYESDNTGLFIFADRSATYGQRDVHITVEPVVENIQASLQSYVSTEGTINPVEYSGYVPSATGIPANEKGDMINGTCAYSVNKYVCNLRKTHNSKLNCTCSIGEAPSAANLMCNYDYANSTSSIAYFWTIANGVLSARDFTFKCHGEL